jgi:Bifunctional DNA primase/polymerase, N-terminal
MTAPDFRAAAHAYLERGFLPVGWVTINGTKAAVSMKGRHYADYSVSHAEIDRWPRSWQPGLAMCQRSGHWALDFDCTQQRADEFLAAQPVTRTATQLTGRGFHLVYRGTGGPPPWPRDRGWSKDWPDVQVRSNGFIAAAPSVHPNGRQYRWADSMMPAEPGTLLLGLRPEREPRYGDLARRERLRDDGSPHGDLAYYAQHGIPFGWQDDELQRLACRHVRTTDRQELFGYLWAAVCRSVQNQRDLWSPEAVMAKIARAAEFTQREDDGAWKAARAAGWVA